MEPRLVVLSGTQSGGVFSLPEGDFAIGRDAVADLAFALAASESHRCVISVRGDHREIEDCGSGTGTWINGERLETRHTLSHGDRIETGGTEFVFLLETDTAVDSSVEFDHRPTETDTASLSDTASVFLDTMVEFARTLRYYRRDSASIRRKLLSFLFTIVPAERAALVLVEATSQALETVAQNREGVSKVVLVNRALAERVYREGKAAVTSSTLCVPLQGLDRRLGVLYAEAREGYIFDSNHLDCLRGVAAVGAIGLEHAVLVEQLVAENSRLRSDLDEDRDLIGNSPQMVDLGRQILKIAAVDSTVLVQGESGTGKELVARAIHRKSKRSTGPFVAINCGAIPESTFESELFGHEKGAFTGATGLKKGKFELASGGTLFLDEVGELPQAIQVKLLRALQEREIDRLGGSKPVRVDIRVVAASNRDLAAMTARHEFRQDLYFRLNVVTVTTPPLRERPGDIPLLTQHFVKRLSGKMARAVRGVLPETEKLLSNYDWPGNVRELQNVIERAMVLGSTEMVRPEDLPDELCESGSDPAIAAPSSYHDTIAATKRDLLEKAFHKANGNWKDAAELLGLYPTHVYRLLKNLGMTHLLKTRSNPEAAERRRG